MYEYIGCRLEIIVDESRYDWSFAHILITYQNHFKPIYFSHTETIEIFIYNTQ